MKKLCTLFVFVLLFSAGHAQSWQSLMSTPINRLSRSAAFSIGTKGYILAGSYASTAFSYDAVANSWTQIADYPAGTTDGTVACSINGIGYVGTGVQGSSFTSNFFSYDPGTGNWTPLPDFPGSNRAYAVMFALDGKVYLGGGLGPGSSPNTDFYTFDPVAGAWDITPIQSCPALGISCDAVSFVIGDKAYVGSGGLINSSQQSVPQNDFWEYDNTSKVWSPIASLPGAARAEANAFATCDKGFVGLGYTNIPRDAFATDFWEYNPAKDKWTQIADFAGGARSSAFSFTINRTGYVCAGLSNNFTTEDHDLWSYTPTPDVTFTAANSSSTSICAGQSVAFNDTSNFGPTNWLWTFQGGTPGTSTEQNPVIRYDTAGAYNVSLIAWNPCDSGTQSFTKYITVGQATTLNVTADPAFVCSGQPSSLTVVAGSGVYQWSPAAGLSDSTSVTISVSPTITTTYSVTQQGSGGTCPSSGQVTLTVGNNTIGGHVTAARDTICAGTPANLLLSDNSSNTIIWQSSSTNTGGYAPVGPADTTKYRTDPLTQSTWFRAIVGSGACLAASDSLHIVVPPALTASFTSTTAGKTVTFNSSSSIGNINNYFWDFGDGNTSNDSNPVHTYAKDTIYNPCLTIYDGSNCSYTFCRSIALGIQTISADGSWGIYPNPFSNELNIDTKTFNNHVQSLQMYDVLGRVVISEALNSNNSYFHLSTSSLANGMYYLMIRTTEADYVQKVVKQ